MSLMEELKNDLTRNEEKKEHPVQSYGLWIQKTSEGQQCTGCRPPGTGCRPRGGAKKWQRKSDKPVNMVAREPRFETGTWSTCHRHR